MATLSHWERLCILFLLHKEHIKTDSTKNKELAYTSVGFKIGKGTQVFYHQNSKCHKGAATLTVIVPSCGNPLAMMNRQLAKSRAEERKYLKVGMYSISHTPGNAYHRIRSNQWQPDTAPDLTRWRQPRSFGKDRWKPLSSEDFLGYYELPNIKSDSIVGAIKDSLVRFKLLI